VHVWRLAFGVWRLVFGVWRFAVCGSRFVGFRSWKLRLLSKLSGARFRPMSNDELAADCRMGSVSPLRRRGVACDARELSRIRQLESSRRACPPKPWRRRKHRPFDAPKRRLAIGYYSAALWTRRSASLPLQWVNRSIDARGVCDMVRRATWCGKAV
jgi:hypothetical protein